MTSILILAAGQSTRMRGRDKLAEDVDGTPLLRLQCQRACATGLPVFAALPSKAHPRQAFIDDLDVTPIAVPHAADGIGVTLRTALDRIPMSGAVLICLADLVALETSDLSRVIAAKEEYPKASVWRGATADGKPGHPILISDALRADFAALTGDQGGAAIMNRYQGQTHLVQLPSDRALMDLDTPEDWAHWRRSRQK